MKTSEQLSPSSDLANFLEEKNIILKDDDSSLRIRNYLMHNYFRLHSLFDKHGKNFKDPMVLKNYQEIISSVKEIVPQIESYSGHQVEAFLYDFKTRIGIGTLFE